MTSYTQNDYYFNEIDALSCNNRPISSTLRSKSTYNAYESQPEDETTSYDLYGNQEYNDGSSCDSYNHHQRSASTMSNAGNYNVSYYSNDYNQYCKNVITTDNNLIYHRDACSGDSSDRYDIYSTLDYGDYDNLRGEYMNYGTTTVSEEGNGRPFTSLGDSNNKMLPQVPPGQHSSSNGMWDGMYSAGQNRQSNVSLPSTPTFRYNSASGVGGRGMASNNGDWDRGFVANGVKAQLNGQRHYDHNGGSGFYDHKSPERVLPLPQSHARKYLKQAFFEDITDSNMATTTTSMSAYRNQLNLDYKKELPFTSASQNLPPHNDYYDIMETTLHSREKDYNNSYNTYESCYSLEPRPHTAMQQTTDEYNDFGLNSMDNMSTYSDKCRYSIIMAMTTASVIASGETRIPQHLLKKTPKTTSTSDVANTASVSSTSGVCSQQGTGAGLTSSMSYKYEDNSGFASIASNNKSSSSISGSNNIQTSCAYKNVTITSNLGSATLPPVSFSTAASSSILLLSSASPIVADSANNSSMGHSGHIATATTATGATTETSDTSSLSLLKNLTSRKLPKHHHTGHGLVANKQLPQSPQYQLYHAATSKALPQAPQLSLPKANENTFDNINSISPILPATSTTSCSSLTSSTFSLAYQATSLANSGSLLASATKTEAAAATSSSLSTHLLLPNNNNNTTTDVKSNDNFNNYKNNNFFNNNVQTAGEKYCTEPFQTKQQQQQDKEKAIENSEAEADTDGREESIYHSLSTTPSRLNSLTAINDITSESYHHQYKKTTQYDSLFSPLPASASASSSPPQVARTEVAAAATTTTTTSTLDKTTTSLITETDHDYKTTYDYSDYLKPYTLPTFSSSGNSNSNNTNNQFTNSSSYLPSYPSLDIHSNYLTTLSSIITTDTSTPLTTSSTLTLASASSTSASVTCTPAHTTVNSQQGSSKILAINNTGLNNMIKALNLSDNNISSRKSSISSPVTTLASPSNCVVPITSITSYAASTTTTSLSSSNVQTSIASSSSNILATFSMDTSPITQTKESETSWKTKTLETKDTLSSSALYIDNYDYDYDYDSYFKDFKLGFTTATATASKTSPTTYTPATTITSLTKSTTSSSMLNNSWPTSTMSSTSTTKATIQANENIRYTINNNEAELASVLSLTPNCLFTTTETTAPKADSTPTSTHQAPIATSTSTATTTTTALYADYLKDYSAVTASSSTSFAMADATTNHKSSSQELPSYIMDFLSTSKSNDYDSQNYLNLYKFKEEDNNTITYKDIDSVTDIQQPTTKTANNNNIISSTQTFPNRKSIIASTPSDDDLEVRAATVKTESTITTQHTSGFPTTSPSPSTPIAAATTKTATENQLTANTALTTTTTTTTMVDFDDSFYNSFSVNLNSLMTADTTISETISMNSTTATAAAMPVTNYDNMTEKPTSTTSSIDKFTAPVYFTSDHTTKSLFNNSGLVASRSEPTDVASDSYTTSTVATTTTHTSTAAVASSSSSTSTTSQKTTTTTGTKAATMLGGLSQSLKGGLDGVLAAAGSNEPQQQKRGFGFGLASKFVPNVGGLLSAATATTKSTTPSSTTTQSVKTVTADQPKQHIQTPQISESTYNKQIDYNNETTAATTAHVTSSSSTSGIQDGYYDDYVTTSGNNVVISDANNQLVSSHATDLYGNGENDDGGVSGGGLYYNSSQPTFYHMTSSQDYAHDDMGNHSEQMMMYDDAVTGDANDVGKEYYVDENQAIDVYGGYSEYETVATTGHFIDTSMAYSTVSATVAAPPPPPPTAVQSSNNNSATVTAAKKATSSLFSSLTNVASQISQPSSSSSAPAATTVVATTTCASTSQATSTKSSGGGGGMFGSIFGKAAAAMQTATQVVNQGATMASTKVQKNLQPTAAVSLIKRVPTTDEPTTTTCSANYYQRSVTSHQDSLVASPYASSYGGSGDDYENSNMPNTDGQFDEPAEELDYYYSNQNHHNILQQSPQKLLPTVPPAGGSTGKKLPTINDKSGCLVKQQPTEIYEEDTEVLDIKSLPYKKKIVPTYDIDSEQADYYMDTQPVAPSASHMAANGYYEHTNGGSYDYRDDFFNEEDELKYLEKEEKILAKQDVIYRTNKHQQQQQQQLRQIQKQSSLQYVVDDDDDDDDYQQEQHDEYMDDMYHSEDSGNYLDESSSGSVKGLRTHQQQVPATTTAASLDDSHHPAKCTTSSALATATTLASVPTSAPPHQQIKKQDSIILEEDEKDDICSIVGLQDTTTITASPSKSLSRKSSHDIDNDIEDDQMGDLQMVSAGLRSTQSRKMKLMRGETEEVVGGHMQIMKRKTEVTAKQRWHWAYNKIIMQLNVSTYT